MTQDYEALKERHAKLKSRVFEEAFNDKKATIYLSVADQETIMAYELMETLRKDASLNDYFKNHITADTFIYKEALAARNFFLEGHGLVKGGEFNYVSVGMMTAHYGHSLLAVATQSVIWNGKQLLSGEGPHNYFQMFSGSFWAGYGHGYYESNK